MQHFKVVAAARLAVTTLWLLSTASICSAQQIDGFTLINAGVPSGEDTEIRSLNLPSDTIDLSPDADGNELSIRADVSGTGIGSIIFDLDFVPTYQTENRAPYALNGNLGSDYRSEPSLAEVGTHVVTATAYSDTNGNGDLLATKTVTLGVAVGPSSPVAPVAPPTNAPTIALTSEFDVAPYNHGPNGLLSGELQKWHKITIGFDGPLTSETATPNPFTFYRLDVAFTHADTGKTYTVPGYYAADGNAANSGSTSGNVWLVHFTPDETGVWTWVASFVEGTNVAQNDDTGTSSSTIDGKQGSFSVQPTNKSGRDHRGKGRLQYVNEHHLQFAETGEYFLKAGADSPENFLAYDDFDDTPNYQLRRKSWAPHLPHYRMGDPTWRGGKGRAIVGAINYLALDMGVNAFSFLPMNIAGDDKNVFPYVSDESGDDRQRIDVSKTAQWEVVFEHADHIGLYLHFKTQETENDQLLDGGDLGLERKLYYRELIARFGHHLALNWNIGEENTNTDAQRKAFADYIKATDPYDSPIVIHTYPNQIDAVYGDLVGYPTYDGASIQTNPDSVFPNTLKWVQESDDVDRKWVVANDEQGNARTGVMPDVNDPTHDVIRTKVLWGNIMAGGAGVEYYFGYDYVHSDLTCNDFASREAMWILSKHALDFFSTYVPFATMSNKNELLGSSANMWCLANDEVFVVYLLDGGTADIRLPSGETYDVSWYDPRNGGNLQAGSLSTITGAGDTTGVGIGTPPNSDTEDWAALITLQGGNGPSDTPAPSVSTPAPSISTPAPTASTPVPTVATPGPTLSTPVPTVATPGPTVSTPVPTVASPGPTASTPVPTVATPGPTASTPAPTVATPGPTASPTFAGTVGEVTKFMLVDATPGGGYPRIHEIQEGDVLYLDDLPSVLNIEAVTVPDVVGSVMFTMNGQMVRTENYEPYALAGDSSGEFFPDDGVQLGVGSKDLAATPYAGSDRSGTVGVPLQVSFEIMAGSAPGPPTTPAPTTLTPAPTASTPAPTAEVVVDQVTKFMLVDATRNGGYARLHEIKEGDVLYLDDYPDALNVEAVTVPEVVGSVIFEMNGSEARKENVAPYALSGDNPPGVFFVDNGKQLSVGSKQLKATPYTERKGGGEAGMSLEISFEVMRRGSASAEVAATTPVLGSGPTNFRVSKFVLIDVATNSEIREIQGDDTLYLLDLPAALNVRAVTEPEDVGSVEFMMNSQQVRTENVAPYALVGDQPGGPYIADDGTALGPGLKQLSATPYSEIDGGGTAGGLLSIAFTIDAGTAPCENDDTFEFASPNKEIRNCDWIKRAGQRNFYCTVDSEITTKCVRSCHKCPEPEHVSRDVADFTFIQQTKNKGPQVRDCLWFKKQRQTDRFCLPGSDVGTKCTRACGLVDPPCEDNVEYRFRFEKSWHDCASIASSPLQQSTHCTVTAIMAQCPVTCQHPACVAT